MIPPWLQLVLIVAAPIFSAGGAYMGVRVTLKWHWSEIRRAHKRLDRLEERFS